MVGFKWRGCGLIRSVAPKSFPPTDLEEAEGGFHDLSVYQVVPFVKADDRKPGAIRRDPRTDADHFAAAIARRRAAIVASAR